MISEQRLFFENEELDNSKSAADYRIRAGDILILKVFNKYLLNLSYQSIKHIFKKKQIFKATNEEPECRPHPASLVPELGFKGTNLLR